MRRPEPQPEGKPTRLTRDENGPGVDADTDRQDNDEPAGPSKTRRKAEMHDLQQLGETLVGLNAARLVALSLPERLFDAVTQARSITKHEARRRQMQYIGRLMRDVEPAPIRAQLAQWDNAPNAEKARLASVERWRERLLAGPDELDAFCAATAVAE